MAAINSQAGENDEKLIVEAVQKLFKDASDFRFGRVGNQFEDGNTYTVEFTTKDIEKKDYSWFYAYVDASGCQLLKDGEDAIVFMQALLDKRRSFVQRLRDFDLLDIIGAVIAFMIVSAFVYIILVTRDSQNAISKEFLTIVSMVLGYYFGRNKSK